jgi:hypothetical protein
MFLFSHLGKYTFSPKILSNQNSSLCKNKSGMVGEVGLPTVNKIRYLDFTTQIFRHLILKEFFFAFSHPFKALQ